MIKSKNGRVAELTIMKSQRVSVINYTVSILSEPFLDFPYWTTSRVKGSQIPFYSVTSLFLLSQDLGIDISYSNLRALVSVPRHGRL